MSRLTIPLTLRQRAIILQLLHAQDRITHEHLARGAGLTVRVVRYNMPAVRAWFGAQGVRLTSRPGLGIEIEANSPLRRKLNSALGRNVDQDLVLTGAQRRRAFLFQLLTSKTPMSYQNLALQAGSSRSTLIHDVGRVQAWLRRYSIDLVRRPKRGISLDVEEPRRRLALVALLQEELGENRWVNLRDLDLASLARDRSLPAFFWAYLKAIDLPFAAQLVLKLENNLGRRLTPSAHAAILVYLAIAIRALHEGQPIDSLPSKRLADSPEHRVAQMLLQEVSRELGLALPDAEGLLLAAYLLGSEWELSPAALVDEFAAADRQPSPEASEYARQLVAVCAAQLHPLLRIDHELVGGLAHYLDPALHRWEHGIPICNPYLETARARYAEVFRSAADAAALLEREWGIGPSEDEIGYITMYLAAGLARIGTNRRSVRPLLLVGDGNRAKLTLLRSRLEYELPSLEIIGAVEPRDTADPEITRCELIVALVPYKHARLPTFHVSPFLTGEEIRGIRSWLAAKEAQERRAALAQRAKLGIVELLEPSSVSFHSAPIDWRIAVALAAQPLLRVGKIAPSYVDAMTKIVEEYGPYMILAPGVILLHAKPSDGVNSLCFGLLVHKDGIDFGGTLGRVHVVFVLGAVDNQSHLTALFQLSNLIQKPGFVNEMCQTTQPADALQTIWSYLTSPPLDAGPVKKRAAAEALS